MGNLLSTFASDYVIYIKTGDVKGAGTDSNIWFVLYDNFGLKTEPVKLNTTMRNVMERGELSSFQIGCPDKFENADRMEIWRDKFGIGDSWYLEYIVAQRRKTGEKFWFPVQRWILPDRKYYFRVNDCCLPQLDIASTQRNHELIDKRRQYEYTEHIEGGPLQIKRLPEEEDYRYRYKWDFNPTLKKEKLVSTLLSLTNGKWEAFNEMKALYKNYPETPSMNRWNDDGWFAMQRLQGLNPVGIKLCTELPENFGTDEKELSLLLDNVTMVDALENKKIFIVDYKILKNLPCKDDKTLCSPIALFYLNRNHELMPIAIQLFQDNGPDNPVFFPTDPPYTWLLAKMYFNNADATFHRYCLSIARTHLLNETFWISINRNLSPSHPIYKLVAPHFNFLLSVNALITEKLLVMGGWIDKVTTGGMRGLCHLIAREFSDWRFDQQLNIPKEIESRGVNDPSILPYYPYRDDAIILYDSVYDYVGKIIKNHYDLPDKVLEDTELQNWRKELVKSKKDGGCEIKGLPGDENGFTCRTQVIDTVVGIIVNCTIFHAAIDLPQYEESAFIPNYPLCLCGPIPREKRNLSEKDVIEQLPNIQTSLEIIKGLKNLTSDSAKRFGHHRTTYLKEEKDVKAHKEFLDELEFIVNSFKKRNEFRKCAYKWLNPEIIPNNLIG